MVRSITLLLERRPRFQSGSFGLEVAVRCKLNEWQFMAHFGLSSPPAAESVIGGTADILSGNQNRPFLTLNGHLGAVQQMAAPAPIVLMEFFERWSEYLGFIHGFSKNQLGGIVFFAGLFYMAAPMVHEVILRSRTELSALLRKFRLVKISTLSTQSMANGRSA